MVTHAKSMRFFCATFLISFLMQICNAQQTAIPNYKMGCGNEGTSSANTTATTTTTPTSNVTFETGSALDIKYIKVAVHFILPTSNITQQISVLDANGNTVKKTYTGAGNFTETGDGEAGSTYSGFQYAEDVINNANAELSMNAEAYLKDPSMPAGYYTPPPAIPFRYLLVGVFFHRDDIMYYSSSIKDIHDKYDYMGNQVMDIYEVPNYVSGNLNGEAYNIGGDKKGVAVDDYVTYLSEKYANRSWGLEHGIPGLYNHEIGHMLGLDHSWNFKDGCDDTPLGNPYDAYDTTLKKCYTKANVNCWGYGLAPSDLCPTSANPCANWANVSNNIMDYNAAWPSHSYTPCQIDKIKKNLVENGSYIKSCPGSCAPPNAFFWMQDSYDKCTNAANVKFVGVGVNENTYTISVLGANGTYTAIKTGTGQVGTYDLFGLYNFVSGVTYTIKLEVNNTACNCKSEYTKQISFKNCGEPSPPIYELTVKNPIGNDIQVTVGIQREGVIKFQLVHQMTSTIEILQNQSTIEYPDKYTYSFDAQHLTSGNYTLQTIFDGVVVSSTNLVKIE